MFGRDTEVMKPAVVQMPNLGTGPMMLLRAMGLNPEELFQTFAGLEQVLRGAVGEMLERSRVLTENVETLTTGQAELNARMDRIESNLSRIVESFGQVALALQRIESMGAFPAEPRMPAKEATAPRKANGKAH